MASLPPHVPFPTYDDDHVHEDDAAYEHEDPQPPPRFSHLLSSVLGSPFLTTSDLPPSDTDTAYAPSGPIGGMEMDDDVAAGAEMEAVDGAFASVPRSYTVTRPPSPSPSFRTETFSIVNWNPEVYNMVLPPELDEASRCSVAFLQAGRRTISGYPSSHWSSSRTPTPSPIKYSKSLTIGMGIIPKIWDVLREGSPVKRCRRRPGIPSWRGDSETELDYHSDGSIDYSSMTPLDGEEGELIDDEACFIDVRAITGMDIVSLLPLELALYLLSFLDLPSVLSCLRVSRYVLMPCFWNKTLTFRVEIGIILRLTTRYGGCCSL